MTQTQPQLRSAPQNLTAEKSVLGCILIEPRVIEDLVDVLSDQMFYDDSHARVFRVCLDLFAANSHIDAIVVAERLERAGKFAEMGGVGFLLDLQEAVPGAWDAVYYARIVRDLWIRRRLLTAVSAIASDCYGGDDTSQVLEAAERAIFQIREQQIGQRATRMSDLIGPTLDEINARIGRGRISGLATGFRDLDDQTNGLSPGNLVIIGARPSMGKTAFVCNIAEWVAGVSGTTTLLISLEQTSNECVERLLCIRGRLDGHRLKRGLLDDAERHALLDSARELQQIPLHIDDQAAMSVTQIAAICRRLRRREGLGLVIIDYLQLIEPDDPRAPREQQISRISRRLKMLAKELAVPVIALSQLNRGVDTREDKRPRLGDLRESGAIEQDADIVLFLHRPDAYDPADQPGIAEVIVAKHRSGPSGLVKLQWRKESLRYTDVDQSTIPEGF